MYFGFSLAAHNQGGRILTDAANTVKYVSLPINFNVAFNGVATAGNDSSVIRTCQIALENTRVGVTTSTVINTYWLAVGI